MTTLTPQRGIGIWAMSLVGDLTLAGLHGIFSSVTVLGINGVNIKKGCLFTTAGHKIDLWRLATQGSKPACGLSLNECFHALPNQLRSLHAGVSQRHGFGKQVVNDNRWAASNLSTQLIPLGRAFS